MTTYSIIIPTWNAADTLVPLLDSLVPQMTDGVEILVIDDASSDDTAARVADYSITYVVLEENSGPATARNHGAVLARGEWLVFTDADTEFAPDTLDRITEALAACGGDALVGTYAGKPANTGWMPRYKALWEYCTINERLSVDDSGIAPYSTWAPRPGVVRKAAFDAVDGFDPGFRGADLEDLDLGYRLIAAGYRIFYCERVQIKHRYPRTLAEELIPFARRCAIWMRLRRRWPRLDNAGEGSPATATAHVAGFLASLLLMGSAFVPGIWVYAVLLLLLHWGIHRAFLIRAAREGGVAFATACAGLTWVHSTVLGVAAAWGLLTPSRSGK